MTSAAITTTTTMMPNITQNTNFNFGTTDYTVFTIMLTISSGIGIYFGFFAKSKNTTDEYLMGGKKMKTIPIAVSLVASQLSGIAIMSVPAESYAFGINYLLVTLAIVVVIPILCYIIIPVFYENNITNCYEYLQIRFNKRTRQLVTFTFILNSFLMLPIYMFVPALAFAQVTGNNIHVINTIVCSICVFYTMLGGIKAVVWTDVVQAFIMLSSVLLVGMLGTIKTGGLGEVITSASLGSRLDWDFSLDPRIRLTVWNGFVNGIILWTGHIGLNQSCVQRIVSLPSLGHAKKSLYLAGIGFFLIMGLNIFIGIIMFARYYGCDPILTGLVTKPDKMIPFFVQDIMGHLKGMPGIFISCVFSAALSTMSAVLNSLSGVVYFDYIKPYIKHTEAKANYIMKIFVVIMGIYSIFGGFIVQHFTSILQLILTISGISTGAVVGIYLLGMFVSRANGKVALTSLAASIAIMILIIINAQMRFKEGVMRYDPLPTSIHLCESHNLHYIIKSMHTTPAIIDIQNKFKEMQITTAFGSNREFSIFEVSFYWYKVIGFMLVWLIAIPLSCMWKRDPNEKIDPKLYAPFIRKYLDHPITELEEVEVPLKSSGAVKDLPNTDQTEDYKDPTTS